MNPRELTLTALLLPAFAAAQEPPTEIVPAEAKGAVVAIDDVTNDPAPEIPLVRFEGVYADLPEAGGDLTTLLLSGGAVEPKSFYGMLEELQAVAKNDSEVVLFDLTRAFGLNGVQLAELERTMKTLREAGKQCHAYIENAGSATYQVAALCDEIMIADLGGLDLPSLSMSIMFMKDALDLLGVDFDVVRCGDFKGAVEPYMLSSMSKHLREHYATMLEHMNNDIARRIATARGIEVSQVRGLQAQRMLTPEEAKNAGLVDRIVPWRGAEHALGLALDRDDLEFDKALSGKKKRKNFNPMAFLSEMFRPAKEKEVEDQSIVVLHLSGQIVDGNKSVPGSIVSGPSVATIKKLIDNDNVQGVVVRVNSPGGSATASEAILLALRDLAEKKPVVVSMGRLAASGGYYVTCLGRPILAEAGTITGSIGVFGMRPNVGALMRRVGVNNELIALDESAGMTAIDRSWNDEQKAQVQKHVDRIYDVFIGHVGRSRKMSSDDVLKIAGGRVWSGEQAVANGLVDRLGGLDEAITMVAKESGAEDFEIEHLPQPKSFLDALAEQMMNVRALLPDSAQLALVRRTGLDRAIRVLVDALLEQRPTRVWAMLPETFQLR